MATRTVLRRSPDDARPPESGLSDEEIDRIVASGGQGARMLMASAFQVAAERGLMADGQRIAKKLGPQTDDELLEAVEQLTGYHIPRVAVCTEHGHKSPAQTFCDLYFERVNDVLWIGNRGGGKTTNSGFLHGAKNYWHDDYSSALAGAQAHQGQRGYAEFKRFTRHVGSAILKSLFSKTSWDNGSLTEVLGGTVRALNGPHPVFAQLDEAELISTMQVFQEFLNMAQSTDRYQRQQLLTSTRKRAHGIVQQIVKEVEHALRQGDKPPWRVDIFCVFETLARVPNCRNAPENAGRPESELCQCQGIVKGEWEDGPHKGKPRTFADVCGGKAARSDGFVQLDDVHRRFLQLSRSVWEAQQECLTPDVEGVVHKWIKDKHRLPYWTPWPEFGPIYRGWDWGGQNPHAIVWAQKLTVAVGLAWMDVPMADGSMTQVLTPVMDDDEREVAFVIPEGALVQFDEHYGDASQLGEFSTLGLRAVLHELRWRQLGVPIQISGDFCDPAGYIAKREVKKAVTRLIQWIGQFETDEHSRVVSVPADAELEGLVAEMGLRWDDLAATQIRVPEFKSRPAPRYESIRKHIELGEDDMLYYVPSMCPGTDDEYDAYHWLEQKPGKNTPEDAAKEDDHAMDAKRYLIWGVDRIDMTPGDAPTAIEKDAAAAGIARPRPHGKYDTPQTVTRDASLPGAEAPSVAQPSTGEVGIVQRSAPYGGRLSASGRVR
jgi:hypothetical protein